MFLQLLGAYTVWRDLAGTGQEFGKNGIPRRNWSWLKTFFKPQSVILVSADLASGSRIDSVRCQIRPNVDMAASAERRIATLEDYVSRIDKDVAAAFVEISKNERNQTGAGEGRAQALRDAIQRNGASPSSCGGGELFGASVRRLVALRRHSFIKYRTRNC